MRRFLEESNSSDLSHSVMSTKRPLGGMSSDLEYEVSFTKVYESCLSVYLFSVKDDLGFRLEEKISHDGGYSVVSRVTEEGQANLLKVCIGDVLLGINGEKYLSHAHAVSTLKHAKRPVRVRFSRNRI